MKIITLIFGAQIGQRKNRSVSLHDNWAQVDLVRT